MNCDSVPEIRGEPSRRRVAIVLCLCASRRSRTAAASSGAAALEFAPGGHGADDDRGGAAASSETSNAIKRDDAAEMTDRLRELLDLVLGSLDDPDGRRPRARRPRPLLPRPPRPPARRRHRRVAGRAAPAAAARAGRVAAGQRTPRRRARPRPRPATARSPRSAARSPARTASRPRAFARERPPGRLEAPNGVHFHPPAGLLVPGAPGAAARPHRAPRRAPPRPRQRALLRGRRHAPDREALERAVRARPRRRLVRGRGAERRASWRSGSCFTLEVWIAAIARPRRSRSRAAARTSLARHDRAAREFARFARTAPRPRRVGRRVRRRAVRAAAVVHLRRRPRPRPHLRRASAASTSRRCCASSARPCPTRATRSSGSSSGEALDEVQRGLGDLLPAAVDHERVPAVRQLLDLRDPGVALLALVGGVGDRPRDRVVLLAGDDQQRPARRVLRVDLDVRPRVEVRRSPPGRAARRARRRGTRRRARAPPPRSARSPSRSGTAPR